MSASARAKLCPVPPCARTLPCPIPDLRACYDASVELTERLAGPGIFHLLVNCFVQVHAPLYAYALLHDAHEKPMHLTQRPTTHVFHLHTLDVRCLLSCCSVLALTRGVCAQCMFGIQLEREWKAPRIATIYLVAGTTALLSAAPIGRYRPTRGLVLTASARATADASYGATGLGRQTPGTDVACGAARYLRKRAVGALCPAGANLSLATN